MKINIGSSDYELSLAKDNNFTDRNSDGSIGLCDTTEKVILIGQVLSSQSKKQCFFHEIVHAFLDETGDSDLFIDERFVDAFSKQLYSFLSRNNLDKIYKYLKA